MENKDLNDILNTPLSTREDLLAHLKNNSGVFKNPLVEKAFTEVDRKDFLTEDYKFEAYEDYAIPIGHGQTISQPTTVAFMLELLGVEEGHHVLDVGAGSGFTAALLSVMVGDSGDVVGVERVKELLDIAKERLSGYPNVTLTEAEDIVGNAEHAPYDRILVSASATSELPEELLRQLKVGGVLVAPVDNSIWKYTKKENDEFDTEEFPGFVFVPLVEEENDEG